MLSGTDCGLLLLLLLLGGLDVVLVVNAFLRLALLALRAVSLLVILLATNKYLVSYCRSVRQQWRFNDPSKTKISRGHDTRTYFFLGCSN